MNEKYEVGLTLEWTAERGIVLKAKGHTFELELNAEMTRRLRDALVEVLGHRRHVSDA